MKKSLLIMAMEEIKNLRGNKIISWLDGVIDVIDILEVFQEYEVTEIEQDIYDEDGDYVDTNIIDLEDPDDYIKYMEELYDIKYLNIFNTYNWGSPISNNLCYEQFINLDTGDFIVIMKVHRYGDVRCNYTNEFVLQFNSEEEFIDVLIENGKHWSYTDKDKITWYCDFDITNEGGEISNDNGFCESLYDIDDYDGFVEYIKSIE